MAFSSWLGSAWVFHRPPASTVSMRMVSPSVRRSRSDMPATSRLTSTTCGASGCWREKASSRGVSLAARLAASIAASMNCADVVSRRAPACAGQGSWRR